MNKKIGRAIDLAQRLRAVMLQAVALEKEKEEHENSEEYINSIVGDFQEAWSRQVRFRNTKRKRPIPTRALKEQDATEGFTDILAQIDQLLYSLMNLGGDEGWNDQADYEERTQLKLGEALKDRMILAKAIKI